MNLPGLTPQGESSRRVFVGIKEGQLVVRDPETNADVFFRDITGRLLKIDNHKASFADNAEIEFFDLVMINEGVTYVLSIRKDSSASRQIINCLSSVKDFANNVIIAPWKTRETADKKSYVNVSVYEGVRDDSHKLKWAVEQLPKLKVVTVGRKEFYDNSELLDALEKMVGEINARIPSGEKLQAVRPQDVAASRVNNSAKEDDDLPF